MCVCLVGLGKNRLGKTTNLIDIVAVFSPIICLLFRMPNSICRKPFVFVIVRTIQSILSTCYTMPKTQHLCIIFRLDCASVFFVFLFSLLFACLTNTSALVVFLLSFPFFVCKRKFRSYFVLKICVPVTLEATFIKYSKIPKFFIIWLTFFSRLLLFISTDVVYSGHSVLFPLFQFIFVHGMQRIAFCASLFYPYPVFEIVPAIIMKKKRVARKTPILTHQ